MSSGGGARGFRWHLPGPIICIVLSLIVALAATAALVQAEDPPADRQLALAVLPEPSPATQPAGHFTAENCAQCHLADAALSHPVNVRPTLSVPASLPLEEGRITCTTCHVDSTAAHAQARTHPSALLRTADDGTFCIQCHNSVALTRAAQHSAALSRAHLLWAPGSPAGQFNAAVRAPATPITRAVVDETRVCLSCHDGTVASDASAKGDGTHAGAGHPTSVRYGGTNLGSPRTPLVPIGSVDPRLRLFNGQVGCATCHSPYSSEAKLLVMRNDRSALCLSCHKL